MTYNSQKILKSLSDKGLIKNGGIITITDCYLFDIINDVISGKYDGEYEGDIVDKLNNFNANR